MSVLLIDYESTGIDTANDRITEIGAMIVTDDYTEILGTLSTLVYSPEYPPLTPEVIAITGITPDMLKDAVTPEEMTVSLTALVAPHQDTLRGIVAYNAPFDKGLFTAEVTRQTASMLPIFSNVCQLPWVCAMRDVEENIKCKSWKLMHVALDHGVTVNPKELHRAINDVELMRIMLVEIGQSYDKMLTYHEEPTVYVMAKCRPPWEDGGASTTVAKGLGFTWQVAKGDEEARIFKNRWVRKLKQRDWVKLQETSPIQVALM